MRRARDLQAEKERKLEIQANMNKQKPPKDQTVHKFDPASQMVPALHLGSLTSSPPPPLRPERQGFALVSIGPSEPTPSVRKTDPNEYYKLTTITPFTTERDKLIFCGTKVNLLARSVLTGGVRTE